MPKSFKRTGKQEEALTVLGGPAMHCMLFGGSRSGKTFEIIEAIVGRALAAKGSRHAILRFRFNHVKASVVHDTFPKVVQLCFPEVSYHLDKSDWYARFPNESEIWFGGLDDKERTEKILGNEYATIFLNECSQIPWASRNIALTRLAQKCTYEINGSERALRLKMYYDENPPSKAHWSYKLFVEGREPDTRQHINQENYACLLMNPEDNRENLPEQYLKTLDELPVRMHKRFRLGEFADTTENALWTDEIIDKWRSLSGDLPDMQRVIVGVDPSGSDDEDNADNDEIGIIVGGLGTDGNGYVLEDLTIKAGPGTWGKIATGAYERHQADLIVAEKNFGGAMVKHVIQTARPRTPYRSVNASRGKVVRAEPISALTEQGKIRFVGYFPALEDQLCSFTTMGYMGEGSPNNADAFVWVMSELFPGLIEEPPSEKKPRKRRTHVGAQGWMG